MNKTDEAINWFLENISEVREVKVRAMFSRAIQALKNEQRRLEFLIESTEEFNDSTDECWETQSYWKIRKNALEECDSSK